MSIDMQGVKYFYPGNREPVLEAPSCRFELDGSLHIVVGPNGSGKTTLCKLICGVLSAKGVHVPSPAPVLLWQDLQLFPTTVGSNIQLVCKDRRVVDRVLERFGLRAYEHVSATRLSGGERGKLALARALATGRDTIVFDEPTASLDAVAVEKFGRELLGMENLTRIVVTHDRSFFSLLASSRDARVYVLEPAGKGGLLTAGRPVQDFVRLPPTVFAARFLGYENLFSLPASAKLQNIKTLRTFGDVSEMQKRVVVPLDAVELSNVHAHEAIRVTGAREEFRSGGQQVVRVEWVRGGGYKSLEFVALRNGADLERELYLSLREPARLIEVGGT